MDASLSGFDFALQDWARQSFGSSLAFSAGRISICYQPPGAFFEGVSRPENFRYSNETRMAIELWLPAWSLHPSSRRRDWGGQAVGREAEF